MPASAAPSRVIPSGSPSTFAVTSEQTAQAAGPANQPQSSKKLCGSASRQSEREDRHARRLDQGRPPEDRSAHAAILSASARRLIRQPDRLQASDGSLNHSKRTALPSRIVHT